MKILLTHEKFPPEVAGGGETIVFNLVKGLQNRGYDVHVITTGNPKIKQYDGVKTKRIPMNRYLMNLSFPLICKYAKDFDLIQTTSGNFAFPSWITAKTLDKPICCLILHLLSHCWKDIRGPFVGTLFQFFEKMFIGRDYDSIVVMNDYIKKLIKDVNSKSKIYLIPPGFDFRQQNQYKKDNSVLFVGNISMNEAMSKVKGLPTLLEVANNMPDTKFYIVGKGDYMDKLKESAPKNVIFTGPLFGKRLYDIYGKSSVYCQLSLNEGFGLRTVEAMAAGCAIVSTINIGQKGILVEPKNSRDVVNALKYFLDNPDKARKVGIENKKIVKKFTWDRFVDGFVKIYDSMV